MTIVGDALRDGRTVVIDEFQRLPDWFIDEVAMFHPNGRLILSGSSMRVVDSILGSRSPLLLLIFPYKLDLVRPRDLLISLKDLDPINAIQFGSFLQEPWLLQFLDGFGRLDRQLFRVLTEARYAVPALVGEVFIESERSLSQTYEAIIRVIGSGEWKPSSIAHRLQNSGLIRTEGSNYLHEYLKNLETMGLVRSVPIFGKGRQKSYRLASPLMDTFYYLADKHQMDEMDRPFEDVSANIQQRISFGVERFLGRLFKDLENGQLEYSFDPELDFVITKGREREPVLVGEVKWGKYYKSHVKRFDQKVKDLPCRKVFITKRVTGGKRIGEVDLMDARDVVHLAS
jgi:hypothetical protein